MDWIGTWQVGRQSQSSLPTYARADNPGDVLSYPARAYRVRFMVIETPDLSINSVSKLALNVADVESDGIGTE